MVVEMSLLDALAMQARCESLSDLRYIDDFQRLRLARMLEKISPQSGTLFEWNDALEYLTGDPHQPDPGGCKRTADARIGPAPEQGAKSKSRRNRHMKRRILASLMAICLLVGLLPVTALAEAGDWDPLYDPDLVAGTLVGRETFSRRTTCRWVKQAI